MTSALQTAYRMTTAQLREELASQKRRPKFRNKPTSFDGIRFASKREAAIFAELQMLQKCGFISDLQPHPKFTLVIKGPHGQTIETYTADASYFDEHGKYRVIDVKSPVTAGLREFKRNVRLMRVLLGINVEVRE